LEFYNRGKIFNLLQNNYLKCGMLFAIFRWYLFKGGNAMFTTKSLFTDFDRMFDSLYSTYQYDNEYYSDGKLEIDLPGVKKEDVEIECKNQVLHVTAKRKSRDWVLDRKYRLNSKVDVDNIDAKFEDGVLTLTFKELEELNKTKKIALV
jgi:HSP20 family molecular chaperone IbpA